MLTVELGSIHLECAMCDSHGVITRELGDVRERAEQFFTSHVAPVVVAVTVIDARTGRPVGYWKGRR